MNLGGLGARAVLLKEQMKKKPCKRCRMLFDPKKEDKCPYCGDLDQIGLEALLVRQEQKSQGNKQLGGWFIFAAVVLLFLMFLIGIL